MLPAPPTHRPPSGRAAVDTAVVDMAAVAGMIADTAAVGMTVVAGRAAVETVPVRHSDCPCQINYCCPSISPSDILLITVKMHHGHNHITGQCLCATNIGKNFLDLFYYLQNTLLKILFL